MIAILDKNERLGKRILLAVILALGFFLRFHYLTLRPIWYDEAITIFYAKAGLNFITKNFIHGSNPPLAYYFYAVWMRTFGESQLSFEMVSVLFGILTIFSLHRAGKALFSERVGVIAALLLACSYYHVFVSQQIRGYSLACFLCLESVVFFWSFLQSSRRRNLIGWLLCGLLAISTHFYTVFLFLSQLLIFWQRDKFQSTFSKVSAGALFFMIVFFALLKYLNPEALPVYPRPAAQWHDLFLVLRSAWFWSAPLMAGAFILIVKWSVSVLVGKNVAEKRSFIFLFLWFSLSVLIPFLISQTHTSFFYVRYYIFSHLAWILLTAAAIDSVKFRNFISGIFAAVLTWSLISYYEDSKERSAVRLVYEMAENEFESSDVILHENGWTFGPSLFYHQGRLPEFFIDDEFGIPDQWNKKINLNSLTHYKRIWLFMESIDRFYALTQESWFQNLRPKLIKQDLSRLWFLFEVNRV